MTGKTNVYGSQGCTLMQTWIVAAVLCTVMIVYAVPWYCWRIGSVVNVDQTIGEGYFDLAFIDHSDNFEECWRPLGSDVRNDQASLLLSNVSMCEEKQFESQVLQPEWSWGGAKFKDLYVFNVTNPGLAAGGAALNLQELAPLFLSSRSLNGEAAGVVTVNRADLDSDGRLTYKVKRNWRHRAELKPVQRTATSDEVIVPHYIFAAALYNSMPLTDVTSAAARTSYTNQGIPAYYPLFVKLPIAELLGLAEYRTRDPLTSSAADTPFTLDMLEQSPTSTSYFVSSRHGVQGFGFIRYAWDGADIHCGYDADCGDSTSLTSRPKQFQLSKEKAVEASKSCAPSENCQPVSLVHANNGVQFGVSAFKHLPSASFNEIPQVTGQLWDYKEYGKDGTLWTGFNTEHYILYDVRLDGEGRYMRVPVHRWSLSKLHRRTENCGGGGGDSAGLDCSGQPSTVFIGSARDPLRPGPMYYSQSQFNRAEEHLDVVPCANSNQDIFECRMPQQKFEMLTDVLFGSTICYRESSQISLKLQESTAFGNKSPLVPLAWKKDHHCLTGGKMYELMRLHILNARRTPSTVFLGISLIIFLFLGLLCPFLTMRNIRKMDMSSHLGDKPCH